MIGWNRWAQTGGAVALADRVRRWGEAVGSDTSDVAVRTPNAETLARYRSDPAYSYEEEASGFGWWDRFWRWVFDQMEPGLEVPWMEDLLYIGALLIVTVILVGAVRWMLRMRVTPPMEESSAVSREQPITRNEMETVDFAARAETAAEAGDYRRAVRNHYLAVLQHLMQADLIHWTPTKANRALVRETRDHAVHESFARATDVFEAVRYGGLSVDADAYARIRGIMHTVRDSLQSAAPSS